MQDLEGKVVYVAGSIDKHMALEQVEVQVRVGQDYFRYRLINLKTLEILERWQGALFIERDLKHTQTVLDKLFESQRT